MALLVTGWVALDDIETPFEKREAVLGGSATAAAVAAALFTDVRLLAAVGPDFPDEQREVLRQTGIDLAGLATVEGRTSRWGGRYQYDMNIRDTIYTELGVSDGWRAEFPMGWERSTTAFLAAGDPVLQRELLGRLDRPLATMVDTIRLYIDNAREELDATFAAADFVCLNDGEAREIAGTPSVATATRQLLSLGIRGAAVKLGEYGAVFASREDYFAAAGYPLEVVVDPTGAGDAFAGAFMGYIDAAADIRPETLRRATVYGCTVASYAVEGFGPERLLGLTRDDVERRYREIRSLTIVGTGD
jgi:sugar/nucleoside kinase (ribokinase family)